MVPIAFVNEHIETLHELDIEYCHELAQEVRKHFRILLFILLMNEEYFMFNFQLGIGKIRRAAAPNDHPIFIDALADIVDSHLKSKQSINPKFLTRCPRCVNLSCDASKSWYAKICKS